MKRAIQKVGDALGFLAVRLIYGTARAERWLKARQMARLYSS